MSAGIRRSVVVNYATLSYMFVGFNSRLRDEVNPSRGCQKLENPLAPASRPFFPLDFVDQTIHNSTHQPVKSAGVSNFTQWQHSRFSTPARRMSYTNRAS